MSLTSPSAPTQIDDHVAMRCIIIGMGVTGLSVAKFLHKQGERFCSYDSRLQPPLLDEFKQLSPAAKYYLGDKQLGLPAEIKTLIVSPGVELDIKLLQQARQQKIKIISDIDLFAQHAQAPIIAITGSNGKSTVTCLLTDMINACNKTALAGGNLAPAALQLLDQPTPDYYVLELSSFQLELTSYLNADLSIFLNLSSDHLDRHGTLAAYFNAKKRIFRGNGMVLLNGEERLTDLGLEQRQCYYFGSNDYKFNLTQQRDELFIADGSQPIFAVKKIKLAGKHNILNILACLTALDMLEIDYLPSLVAIENFAGLPHRTQWITELNGVNWYNDSKGTNIGACIAALGGLSNADDIILIIGGQAKDQDFTELQQTVNKTTKHALVFGEDQELISKALEASTNVHQVKDLNQAVKLAFKLAVTQDKVLLSPACASFDMFNNYIERGETFERLVRALPC